MGPPPPDLGVRVSESDPGTRIQGQGLDLGGAVRRADARGRAGKEAQSVCYQGCHRRVPGAESCCGALGESAQDVPQAKGSSRSCSPPPPPRPIQQGPSSLTAAPTCLLALPEGFQKALKHPPVARVLGWAPSNGPWGAASCGQEEEETWGGG